MALMAEYETRGLCAECERPIRAMHLSKYCYACTQKLDLGDDNDN